MGLTYFKRFRMEIDLRVGDLSHCLAPPGYEFVAWDDATVDAHAEAKFNSFRGEIDSNVFPCLGEYSGCHRLMHEIRQKEGFLPDATWLIRSLAGNLRREPCGTIQGIRDYSGMGAVQNLGVVPEHRGRGLGLALLRRALIGFRGAGLEPPRFWKSRRRISGRSVFIRAWGSSSRALCTKRWKSLALEIDDRSRPVPLSAGGFSSRLPEKAVGEARRAGLHCVAGTRCSIAAGDVPRGPPRIRCRGPCPKGPRACRPLLIFVP